MPQDELHIEIRGVIPSINDYKNEITQHRMKGGAFEAGWKDHIEWQIWHWFDQEVLDSFPFATAGHPCRVTVRVWRPNRIRRDLPNLFLKPVFDAFSAIGIWEDDNEFVNPEVNLKYMGVDKLNPRLHFTLERIYN